MGCLNMGKNYFTEEQQQILRNNPYIERVSEKAITYPIGFKERFLEEYRSGKLPSEILRGMGLDPRILGRSRVKNLTRRLKTNELRLEGHEDTRKSNTGRPVTKNQTVEEKIKRLEHKVAYLNQENEFLKKNIQMDKQATSKYKLHHQKNTNSSKK